MVTITRAVWRRPDHCRVCGQGDALTFRACTKCGHLLLMCEEEGTVFLDPHRIDEPSLVGTESGMCPTCRAVPLHDFGNAAWEQIQAAGFQPGEYV